MADDVLWSGVPGNGVLQTKNGRALTAGDMGIEKMADKIVTPTGFWGESYDRRIGGANSALGTTGVLGVCLVPFEQGDVISTITFWSATTAASVPLNQWAGVFGADRTIKMLSADKTTEAWPASTAKTFTLTTPYEIPSAGGYYIGLCQVATTLATLCCQGAGAGVSMHTTPPIMAGLSNTGLTTPASLGAGPITTVTPAASFVYSAFA
jgi:hypothetical protein